MKRLLSLTTLLLVNTICCQLYAQGASNGFDIGGGGESSNTKTVCINDVYYSLYGTSSSTSTSATVTSIAKNCTVVSIPSSVTYNSTSYQVRNISADAFKGCTELTSIMISSSWAYSLSREMFNECVNLRTITFSGFTRGHCSDDGILYFYLTVAGGTSSGVLSTGVCPMDYKEEVNIPSSVNGTNVTFCYGVAFKNCRNIRTIKIPQSVTSFTGGFEGCDRLSSFEVDLNNATLKSEDGILFSKDMTELVAFPIGKDGDYTVSSKVTTINSLSFAYNTKPRKIEIGEHIKVISSTAFEKSANLNIVLYAKSGYKDYSFLSNLGENCVVYMHGKFISQAKEYWNGDIRSLEECWIEQKNMYLGAVAFDIITGNDKCQIKNIKVNEIIYDIPENKSLYIKGLRPDSVYQAEISYVSNTEEPLSQIDSVETKKSSITGKNVMIYEGKLEYSVEAETDESVTPSEVGIFCKETNRKYKDNNEVTIGELTPGTSYTLYPYAVYNGKDVFGAVIKVHTHTPVMSLVSKSSQTTITITNVIITGDGTALYNSKGFEINGVTYQMENAPITISGLSPNKEYVIIPYVTFQDKKIYGQSNQIKTGAYSPTCSITSTSSSLSAIGKCFSNEIEVIKENFAICTSYSDYYPSGYGYGYYPSSTDYYYYITDPNNSKKWIGYKLVSGTEVIEGNTSHFIGLSPNKTYYIIYKVSTKVHGIYTYVKEYNTNELTLITEQPKVVSLGNVIVSATTNVDEEEKNVGFEWRRTDWTSDFASNSANAVVYGNTMEGYIRNLNTDKLWKYRAYYLSDAGVYYYGDWVGMDASNTSYFEPTVHTYSDFTTTDKVALVRGYVLNGTDKITVQGFRYWKRANAAHAFDGNGNRASSVSVPADAMTETVAIVGSGQQLMSATLKDLDYSTTYCYVAFATTENNETFYGEEQLFTVGPNQTGIESVKEDVGSNEPAAIVGYYDINGMRLSQPQKGLNILKMSNGTTKKIMVK